MSQYNIIVSTSEATVVSEYEPQLTRSDAYQSEAALEAAFIKLLTEQGYTYLQIHNSDELVENLRVQLEKLNNYQFSDDEWNRFFTQCLANGNDGIVEKTRLIQEDNVQVLKRDDGTSKNITLIDKKNIHNNSLQVINQYVENSGNYDNRYYHQESHRDDGSQFYETRYLREFFDGVSVVNDIIHAFDPRRYSRYIVGRVLIGYIYSV